MVESQQNPRVFGKYEVIRRLAVGGMGEIFLARQVGMAGFDRLVILKSLLPQLASEADMLTQFLDEARIVGSINHPNVVACYEVGEWENVYFIAMEYINGVDVAMLQKAADDTGLRFPVHCAMAIAREAALGLDSAHNATDAHGRPLKIIHRDISPHNVMVRQDGLAKVVDFGVAMAANRQKRTEGGLLKGKLGYMAPEQIKGQPLDGRADQFSLGVMLWELLTGRRLFTAEDPHAVFMKIVRETVPAPSSIKSDVPAELDAVVLKMTAQEPQDRYPRLADAAAVLRKLLEQRGANEHETEDLVRDLVGAQLAERVRDLTPSPVRILGVRPKDEPTTSAAFCSSCGDKAVKGDRFCRSCGTPLAVRHTPSATMRPHLGTPPPVGAGPPIDDFDDLGDDLIDVSFDDASGAPEAAVCVGVLEVLDESQGRPAARPAPEAMLRPVWAHLEELAARLGGSVTTAGERVTTTFTGNGRAARSAVAFARRAGGLAARGHRDLRFRAAVAARPGLSHDDPAVRDDAERVLARAAGGVILVTDAARRLTLAPHAWRASVTIPAEGLAEETIAHEVPPAPRVAGRAAERALVEQAVAAADVGRAQQHLLLGDAGLGKSTLLDLADAEARDRGFIVARVRCAGPPGPLRYDGVRQAIRGACVELLVLTATSGPWHKALGLLGLTAPDRRRLFALVDDEAGEGDDDVPLVRRRVLLRAAILAFFASLAERRGVCLLLDDIHRGDPSSLEVFAEVGARLHASRLVIVAAGRPMHGERVLPFAKRTVLEPLGPRDSAQVAALVVDAALPAAVGDKIDAHVAGSPLFAALLARHLVDIGVLRVAGGQATASVDLERYPLPPSLPVLLFAAHALLPAEARDLLVAASQLGAAFFVGDLAAALDKPVADVLPLLAACTQARALVDEGEGRFAFPTTSERELVAARVDPVTARSFHLALAAALEKTEVAPAGGKPHRPVHLEERLALHLAAAGERGRSALASERAADAWCRLGAVEATVDHFRRALQARWKTLGQDAPAEEAAAALDLAARATVAVGEVDAPAAVDLAMPLVRLLRKRRVTGVFGAAHVEALRTRAALLLRLRRTDEARAALDELVAELPADLPTNLHGSVLLDVACSLEQAGAPDAAREKLQQVLQTFAGAAEMSPRAGEALLALGRLQLRERDLPAAEESLASALEAAKQRGSASAQIDALTSLSTLAQANGKPERALALLDDVVTLATRVGDGVAEARARQQIARMRQQLGQLTEALAAAKLAWTTATRLAWDEGTAVAGQLVTALERR